MYITVKQLAQAINNCGHIARETECPEHGNYTFEIEILNVYGHIVDTLYYTGKSLDKAKQIAEEQRKYLKEYDYKVIPIIKH